jgi:hypothetical protein
MSGDAPQPLASYSCTCDLGNDMKTRLLRNIMAGSAVWLAVTMQSAMAQTLAAPAVVTDHLSNGAALALAAVVVALFLVGRRKG